jgi:hypothetical protein
VIKKLIAKKPLELIRKQIDNLEFRLKIGQNIASKPGWLIKAIEEDFTPHKDMSASPNEQTIPVEPKKLEERPVENLTTSVKEVPQMHDEEESDQRILALLKASDILEEAYKFKIRRLNREAKQKALESMAIAPTEEAEKLIEELDKEELKQQRIAKALEILSFDQQEKIKEEIIGTDAGILKKCEGTSIYPKMLEKIFRDRLAIMEF